MPTEDEITNHYTDFISRDHDVWFFGFNIKALDKEQEVFSNLLLALRDIKESNNAEVRRRIFTVWAGTFHTIHCRAQKDSMLNNGQESYSGLLKFE